MEGATTAGFARRVVFSTRRLVREEKKETEASRDEEKRRLTPRCVLRVRA
jgi:hypothetical protein